MRRELYPNSNKSNSSKGVDVQKLQKHIQTVKKSEEQGSRDNLFIGLIILVCFAGLCFLYSGQNNDVSKKGEVRSVEPNNQTIQTSIKVDSSK
jgi:hypothetical protein